MIVSADAMARQPMAGILGWPVKHSKSPQIFAHWFARTGVTGSYKRIAVEPGTFDATLARLDAARFRGVNVTLPHKIAALEAADEVSDAARAIGAANTLTFRDDSGLHADNTDCFGFIESLFADAPAWRPGAGPALVLGAGGAARGVIHALLEAGVPEIRLTNRTYAKAEALAEHFGARITVTPWPERSEATAGAALIVNTTSLGLAGQQPLEIALDDAPPDAVVNDIVYIPLETPLLAQARTRGLTAVDGLGMLLHQARPGFHRWFGQEVQVTPDLRRAVLAPE